MKQVADLPEQTCLTLVLQVAEGERIQAKTLAGVVSSFDEMQKAVGKELGAKTTTLIDALETVDNEVRITFRICNAPASVGRNAKRRDAQQGSARKGEHAVGEAETPKGSRQ